MQRTLLATALVTAIVVTCTQFGFSGDDQPAQYVVQVTLKETKRSPSGAPGSNKVLAEPKVVAIVGREATFSVQGMTQWNGESIPHGTELKLRIDSAPDKNLTLSCFYDTATT